MKEEKKGVIIIGGHVQGLGAARIFGKNNIPILLLDENKPNITKHSKYTSEFIHYTKSQLIETLTKISKNGNYKNWLILPTNDKAVELVSNNKQMLEQHFKVGVDDFSKLRYFFDKSLSYELVKNLNVPIPITHISLKEDDIDKTDFKYPCIIKPAIMHKFYSKAKKKVFLCNNLDELKTNYQRAKEIIPQEEILIQEVIPGIANAQFSVGMVFDGTKTLVQLCAQRTRQHPIDFGNATTYAETVENKTLTEYAEKILKAVGYKGICEVEFKYDHRDGLYKFLEVNPRTWKWHAIAEKADSPLLMSLYHCLFGLKPIIKLTYEAAAFRHLATDIPISLLMRLKGLPVKTKRKNMQYAVWSWKDLKPAFYELVYLIYFLKTR